MNCAARCLITAGLLTSFSLAHAQAGKSSGSTPSPTPAVVNFSNTTSSKIPRQVQPATTSQAPGLGGGMEILSDTMGVNFRPYMKGLRDIVQNHWDPLIPKSAMSPELKSGKVVLTFAILRDGRVAGLKTEEHSGDDMLDRAAYGAITYSIPLPKLPEEFKGDYLMLRTTFLYNPNLAPAKPDGKPAVSPSPTPSPEKK